VLRLRQKRAAQPASPKRRPSCAGTNYAVRAKALCQVGWYPEYTVGEDYALGMELKQVGRKATYIAERLAAGEAPLNPRDAFRQRSRWAKGHQQVRGKLGPGPWALALPGAAAQGSLHRCCCQ
jgi:hypothetical protein